MEITDYDSRHYGQLVIHQQNHPYYGPMATPPLARKQNMPVQQELLGAPRKGKPTGRIIIALIVLSVSVTLKGVSFGFTKTEHSSTNTAEEDASNVTDIRKHLADYPLMKDLIDNRTAYATAYADESSNCYKMFQLYDEFMTFYESQMAKGVKINPNEMRLSATQFSSNNTYCETVTYRQIECRRCKASGFLEQKKVLKDFHIKVLLIVSMCLDGAAMIAWLGLCKRPDSCLSRTSVIGAELYCFLSTIATLATLGLFVYLGNIYNGKTTLNKSLIATTFGLLGTSAVLTFGIAIMATCSHRKLKKKAKKESQNRRWAEAFDKIQDI